MFWQFIFTDICLNDNLWLRIQIKNKKNMLSKFNFLFLLLFTYFAFLIIAIKSYGSL